MTSSTRTAIKIVVCAALALLLTSLATQTTVHSAAALSQLPTAKSRLMPAEGPLQSAFHARAIQRSTIITGLSSNGGEGPEGIPIQGDTLRLIVSRSTADEPNPPGWACDVLAPG